MKIPQALAGATSLYADFRLVGRQIRRQLGLGKSPDFAEAAHAFRSAGVLEVMMAKLGIVKSIYIAPQAKGRVNAVTRVRAVPGYGLEGDRYFTKTGTFSPKDVPDREVTLIESEAIEGLARDYSIELATGDARRNIVTRGVALNHLVGQEFRVGEALLLGTRLCEPCDHLESLTKPGVRAGLIHRGGLRAQIVVGGAIAVGDELREK